MTETIRKNILKILSLTSVLSVIILWIVLGCTQNVEEKKQSAGGGFHQVLDYSCEEVEDEQAPIGMKKVYSFVLSRTGEKDTHLAFYTVHQYVRVYFDDEEVYSVCRPKDSKLVKTIGSNWTMLPIYEGDVGKVVRIEITPVYKAVRNREVVFLVGSELAIYKNRLYQDFPQLLLSIIAIFVGMVFVFVSGYSLIKTGQGKSISYLGLLAVCLGILRLTDTRFTPFLMPDKPVFLYYVSTLVILFCIIFAAKWTKSNVNKNMHIYLDVYQIFSLILYIVLIVMQLFGKDLRNYAVLGNIDVGVGILLIIVAVCYDRIKCAPGSKNRIENSLFILCILGIILDLIMYYVQGNSSGLMFSQLAFLIYILCVGIIAVFRFSEQELLLAEQKKQLADQEMALVQNEKTLTNQRIMTMMSQIRSHFIFNVLTTISSYCKMDPQKADKALILFSRYLRKNIRTIEIDGLIDFSAELEHVEDYVALEKMRFGNQITFNKDIETTSFSIPPLTIQPLVENAIKHGLIKKGNGGTVWLSTAKEDDNIVIKIVDDGVGFDTEDVIPFDSVGLRNVQYRIEEMVHGTVEIKSKPGEGTTVTISVPCEWGIGE